MNYGTMDGYLKLFKEMILILLLQDEDDDDWNCFVKSKIIDKRLLVNVQSKMNDASNISDIIDDKWCILLQRMIDSFDDERVLLLLNDYDQEEEKKKDKNEDAYDYYCKKNHLMTKTESNTKSKTNNGCCCFYCNNISSLNSLSVECIECEEYICKECINNFTIFNDYLKNEKFDQFEKEINQYNKVKQENILIQVELFVLLYLLTVTVCCWTVCWTVYKLIE